MQLVLYVLCVNDSNGTCLLLLIRYISTFLKVYLCFVFRRAELEEAFKKLDKDGSGALSSEEIKTLMAELEIPVEGDTLEKIMFEADTGKDGTVNINEFCKLFKDLNLV